MKINEHLKNSLACHCEKAKLTKQSSEYKYSHWIASAFGLAMTSRLAVLLIIPILFLSNMACKSCRYKDAEPETMISSDTLLMGGSGPEQEIVKDTKPKIRTIEIGPSRRRTEEPVQTIVEQKETPKKALQELLPPKTYEETDLTSRLQDKMSEAYAGRESEIPDVKIYLSDMQYGEFVDYYRNLGYKVKTITVPASEVIRPVLDQRPDLSKKLNIEDYEGITIRQVMVHEAGISAADKYIDPDTFEVVDKTFVTKMNK